MINLPSKSGHWLYFTLAFSLVTAGWGCGDSHPEADVDLTRLGNRTASASSAPDASEVPSGDWPQWLGPSRNGISPESGWSKEWKNRPPQVVWKISLGEGFSGMAVVDGRVYTMYARGDDEFAVCLDAADGGEIWKMRTGESFSDWQGGDGPRSTPAVDESRAFFMSAQGTLYALDARNGQKLWSCDLRREFDAPLPNWGFSGSPLVKNGRVFVETGGDPGQALAALDKASGRVLWSAQSGQAGYASPIAATVDGIPQIIFFMGRKVVSVSPQDGSRYWEDEWRTSYDVNAASPLFIPPDKLFISSEYDMGGAVFQMTGRNGDVEIERLWKSRSMKNKMSTSVYRDGYIYGFDSRILTCIDARNGEEQWKARGYGEGTLILSDGHLIAFSDRGMLGLIEATPVEFREKTTVQVLSGRCWTPPSMAGGRLYLRNQEEMVCLDLP